MSFVRGRDAARPDADVIAAAQPGPLWFLYRQSPGELVAGRTLMRPFGPSEAGRITRDDPPTNLPGMLDVLLDWHGRLIGSRAVAATADPGVASEPDWTLLICSLAMWVVIGVNVRRNLRGGRGDRKGAWRLSAFLLCSTFAARLMRADHVALAFEEAALVLNLLAQMLLYAAISWLIYIALAPIARRRWPQLLVAWSRLLAGRWQDPMVGRDVLIGVLADIAMALVAHLAVLVPARIGLPSPSPRGQVHTSLGSMRHWGYFVFWSPFAAVTIGFGTLLGLFLTSHRSATLWRNPNRADLRSRKALCHSAANCVALRPLIVA